MAKTNTIIETIGATLASPFVPNEDQKTCKADYWGKARFDETIPRVGITLVVALDITEDTRLRTWWSDPGFRSWFCNGEEWRQRAEKLMALAFDRAEAILLSDDPKLVNAQAKLIEWLTEITERKPFKVKEIKVLDAEVGKLGSAAEIVQWLAARGIKLPGGTSAETTGTPQLNPPSSTTVSGKD